MLLVKQSDQGLHCLLYNLYVLETLFHLRLWLSPLDNRYSGQAYYSMFCYLPWTTGILVRHNIQCFVISLGLQVFWSGILFNVLLSPLDYRYSGHALQVFWSNILFNVLLSPLDYRYSGQAYHSMFCYLPWTTGILVRHIIQCFVHCFFPFKQNMSLVLRKPVFGVSDQVRHKRGCAVTEDG